MGNPFFPMGMMGSGFGNNPGINFQNTQPNPFMFSNPMFMNNQANQTQPPTTTSAQNSSGNNFMSLFQTIQSVQQQTAD